MYRVRNPRGGLFVVQVPHHLVKCKHSGDTKAYYKFTLNDDEATQFPSYSEAEMAGIMLQIDTLEIVNSNGDRASRDFAIANKTFSSVQT